MPDHLPTEEWRLSQPAGYYGSQAAGPPRRNQVRASSILSLADLFLTDFQYALGRTHGARCAGSQASCCSFAWWVQERCAAVATIATVGEREQLKYVIMRGEYRKLHFASCMELGGHCPRNTLHISFGGRRLSISPESLPIHMPNSVSQLKQVKELSNYLAGQ